MGNELYGETVLLTGCVNPNPKVNGGKRGHKGCITTTERVKDYFYAILYYVVYSDFKNIVFCENSNYDFGKHLNILYEVATIYEKKLEILQFKGNDDKMLATYYGYGEGEIINYALKRSSILQKSSNWYKITGRYIIDNINLIIKEHKDDENLFFRLMRAYSFFGICTAFFKVNTTTYEEILSNANDKLEPGMPLEGLYYSILKQSKVKVGELKVIPNRLGRDANCRKMNWLKQLLFKFGCWSYNSKIGDFLHKIMK